MRALGSAGLGFLLAVLWFDLMHDVLVRGHSRDGVLPEGVLDTIARYYARVTTAARPMNRLISVTMLVTLGALGAELVREDLPRWRAGLALGFTAIGIGLAGARVVRNAVRVGTRRDDLATQSALARRVYADHVICATAILAALVTQLSPA